jgi:hypothetical protein
MLSALLLAVGVISIVKAGLLRTIVRSLTILLLQESQVSIVNLVGDYSYDDLPAEDILAVDRSLVANVVRSFAVVAVGRSHYHRHHHSNLELTCLTFFVLGLIGTAPSR